MENQSNNMDELKQQFQLLTDKVKSQQIINDELMRTVLKNEMRWIKKYTYLEAFVAIPIVILCFSGFCKLGYISLPFAIATILICVIDSYFSFKINRIIGDGWLEKDLKASRLTLIKMKKTRATQFFMSIPIMLVWMSFFILETWSRNNVGTAIGGITGIVIAAPFVFSIYKKMQRTNDELIKQIDELIE